MDIELHVAFRHVPPIPTRSASPVVSLPHKSKPAGDFRTPIDSAEQPGDAVELEEVPIGNGCFANPCHQSAAAQDIPLWKRATTHPPRSSKYAGPPRETPSRGPG